LLDWKSIFGVTHLSDDISRVILVSSIFVSLNFIISLCKSIFYALQNAAAVSWMELSIQVLNLILIIIASKFSSENLLMMAILYGASLISVSVLASIFLFYKNPNLIPSLRYFRFDIGKEITSLGLQFFIIQISALVLFTTDNLIISSLYGASNVTPYTTVNKLFTVVSSFYLAIITPLWSSFTVAKAKKDLTWMRNIYKKIHILMIPFFLGIIGLGLLFRSITFIWLGRNLDYQNGLIFFGAIYGALTIWCNTYAMIGNGLGLMRVSVITAIAQAVINIPLSLFCAITLNMQSSGVLLGTVLAMLISASIIPIFVYMYIFKSGSELV
ncbi:MAG: hypothetical protein K0M45_04600, partial [Candidatus Paracaedibacteraceae bacterium]|nr:hypothetical protein [Candidatus Paracaedibacteraceae bacterium]